VIEYLINSVLWLSVGWGLGWLTRGWITVLRGDVRELHDELHEMHEEEKRRHDDEG
jgi:hypothetical protein